MKFGFITVAAAIPSVKVADTEYNIKQIEDFVAQAEGRGVEIIVFPCGNAVIGLFPQA